MGRFGSEYTAAAVADLASIAVDIVGHQDDALAAVGIGPAAAALVGYYCCSSLSWRPFVGVGSLGHRWLRGQKSCRLLLV